jgi:hypothetical protein
MPECFSSTTVVTSPFFCLSIIFTTSSYAMTNQGNSTFTITSIIIPLSNMRKFFSKFLLLRLLAQANEQSLRFSICYQFEFLGIFPLFLIVQSSYMYAFNSLFGIRSEPSYRGWLLLEFVYSYHMPRASFRSIS